MIHSRHPTILHFAEKLRWDWYEQEESGSMVLYCKTQEASVKVTLESDHKKFRLDVISLKRGRPITGLIQGPKNQKYSQGQAMYNQP